ncbi:MmgE/PrpD family protein [Halalkalicoccus tibetensis]|uniref:MmgE/PrpD family protein n=1 Tax=Halalkalicoccus tibetensis TaxID=175632 RepID=A0ABD5V7Z7_9EURY
MIAFTDRLAEHCASREPVDAPGEALRKHVLDWFGVAIGGAAHADSTPALFEGTGDAGSGTATVIPTGNRRPPGAAALVNGTLAHSLDFDDTHLGSSLHPGAPSIAAALATAEATDAPTERFLTGVAVGYDVACTVGEAVNPDAHYARGFHVTATCGTFGATAAAGVVHGLTEREFADAFGINGSQAAGSLQFLANGAWNKRLHPGLAARRAVTAVELAAAGFEGAAEPIEGEFGFLAGYTDEPRPERIDRLEGRNAVAETGLKPYPCCRYMHPAIDALRELAPVVGPEAVTGIEVALPEAGVRLTGDPIGSKRRPENFVDCQFSMPFAAALALSEGAAGAEPFLRAAGRLDDPPRFEDRGFRRLMDATDVTTDPEVQAAFPERWCARVVVEAGDRYERFVDVPRGEPSDPMAWEAVVEKARGLIETAETGVDPDALARAVERLPDRSVGELVAVATGE